MSGELNNFWYLDPNTKQHVMFPKWSDLQLLDEGKPAVGFCKHSVAFVVSYILWRDRITGLFYIKLHQWIFKLLTCSILKLPILACCHDYRDSWRIRYFLCLSLYPNLGNIFSLKGTLYVLHKYILSAKFKFLEHLYWLKITAVLFVYNCACRFSICLQVN
jgi:hypothetical protein